MAFHQKCVHSVFILFFTHMPTPDSITRSRSRLTSNSFFLSFFFWFTVRATGSTHSHLIWAQAMAKQLAYICTRYQMVVVCWERALCSVWVIRIKFTGWVFCCFAWCVDRVRVCVYVARCHRTLRATHTHVWISVAAHWFGIGKSCATRTLHSPCCCRFVYRALQQVALGSVGKRKTHAHT